MSKRGGKKAQITMFVILGLVVLIIFLLIYFFLLKKPGNEVFKAEPIPEELKPVPAYVEGCIHQVGIDAIKKMGAHGGYIDPSDKTLTPVKLRFSSADQTLFELASLTGDSAGAVPYYLHVPGKSSYLNYQLDSVAPTIESMNYQLSVYMDRELPKCTGTFASLQERGVDVKPDNTRIYTQALIKDNDIEFIVTYPLNVTKDGVSTSITKYQNIVAFPFKKYYDLAINIMVAEMLSQFLESYTKSLITYHSALEYNALPPVVEYSEESYIITWSNAKVKNDLNGLLLSYTPVLAVVGTKNYQSIKTTTVGNTIEANFYKSLSMDMFNDSLPNTSITFFYVDNGLVSKVQPSTGDMIKPNIEVTKGNQFIPASNFNSYKFYYDVSYPVIVEIRGDEPGTEIPKYSFLFALEENLIENKGALAWNMGLGTVNWDSSYINTTFTIPNGSVFDSSGKTVNVKPITASKSLFCEEATWISGNVSVRTVDASTGAPLESVSISYGCGNYGECEAGNTALTPGSNQAEWTGKLPLCTGGRLSLNKEGYGSKTIKLSTQEGQNVLLATQKLDKIREINATLKKFEIQKNYIRLSNWSWEAGTDNLGTLQDLSTSNEQVILTITQTGFETGTSPLANSLLFGKNGVSEQIVKLVPGDYEVTATFIDNNGILIPANCSRNCKTDVLVCLDYEYYPNESVNMTPAPWGGIEIKEGTTGVLKITADQLDNNKEIEFRVLKLPDLQKSSPPGACLDALGEMNKIGDYSTKYKADIMPVFK